MDVYQLVFLGCLALLLGFMLLVPYIALLAYRYFAAHRTIDSSLPALKWSSVLTVIGCEAACLQFLVFVLLAVLPDEGILAVPISPPCGGMDANCGRDALFSHARGPFPEYRGGPDWKASQGLAVRWHPALEAKECVE